MLFKPLFAASSVVFAALAAADGTSTSSTSTPTSTPQTIKVKVSDDQVTLKFFPDVITANVGDTVQFEFYPKVCYHPPPPFSKKRNQYCCIGGIC